MKKLFSLIVAIVLFSNVCFADCNFKDLVHNPDGTVTYSKADHVCVGQAVQDNATKDKQIQTYKQALDLKDLAITKSDARAQNWMDTSLKTMFKKWIRLKNRTSGYISDSASSLQRWLGLQLLS